MSSIAATNTHTILDRPKLPVQRGSSALFGLRITLSGLLYTVVITMVGLAALNSEANLLFMIFGIGVGVLVFSAVACRRMVRLLQVDRVIPNAVVAGRPFRLVYVVRSRRRWLRSLSLVISEAGGGRHAIHMSRGFVGMLEPGSEYRVELTGCCPGRGRVQLRNIRVLSRFPLGLFSCHVDYEAEAELVVYPAVGRLRRDPWRTSQRVAAAVSRKADRRIGHDEFSGLREYREGDNPRWVHWRRSARVGQLLVREHEPLRATQLLVLVDPWPKDPSGHRRINPLHVFQAGSTRILDSAANNDVERVISAAATALCHGLERGHRVGLICRSGTPIAIAPSAGRPHRERMLHELALLEPGQSDRLDQLVSRVRWTAGLNSRCLICTTEVNDTHERLRRMLATRVESVTVIWPDSPWWETFFETAGEPHVERGVK